jgi:hypothetical protein
MELSEIDPAGSWAPEACTLPASERPRRAAEFDALFAAAVRGIERAGPATLRLDLQPAAAETGCCSFFTFTITVAAGRLLLDITVPAAQAGTLDLLAGHAAAAAGIAAVSTGGTAA